MERIPKNYSGIYPTGRQAKEMLSNILNDIDKKHLKQHGVILKAWPKIIGEKGAAMAKAVSFVNGILTVKVSNSVLFSLLALHEKPRLLKKMIKTFPSIAIRDITFRMG